MATILLSALGASVGSGFGGTVLGLGGAVIGRAVGASVGRVIDQRLLGGGARAVETGRIDRLRLQTAGEGVAIANLWGQMRVPGHVIWASPLEEMSEDIGGGKGTAPKVTEISYRMSLAVALCEGPIRGVGRIWADGAEIEPSSVGMRVYRGDRTQLPDPCIAAYEGEEAPAYRDTAYVVFEELELSRWGNRIPQFSFEVVRGARSGGSVGDMVQAVAMIPGTGEYSLATTPVRVDRGFGEVQALNQSTQLAETDFLASMDILGRELPRAQSVSLVVSWFGDDLRVGHCQLRPKVEDRELDATGMAWRAGGISRAEAEEVARLSARPIYGGTPSDQSVVEALREISDSGRRAVFYPFILMEQIAGNGRVDPWSGAADQPVMPWRGRITAEIAPGREGSPDGTAAGGDAVAAFFGDAAVEDFHVENGEVHYSGPDEWSYRRFILHYAHLCALAGGVDTFLIGSEMVGLTQLRGADGAFVAVAALRQLAAEVRGILGPSVKLSYAADWSEYFGYHPGGGDVHFHLDPLWADPNIDFVGIDNYMPLSDWRDGEDHLDAGWRDVHSVPYLMSNVAGGEGFDWYYADPAHRDAQIRTPITDGAHGEDWIWRVKDLKSWWSQPHHDRVGGVRSAVASPWRPGSKPIWFTEMGCAALDKGTNQPNKFLDALSSESRLPHYSNGQRDDAMQSAYLAAMYGYWGNPANNPVGEWGGPMVDMSRAHVWCWDARPFPAFPGRVDLWSDGPAWERGHWLNGRAGAVALASVVRDICASAGVVDVDCSDLVGVVRGYAIGAETPRAALQTLMLAFGFDAVERDGVLRFLMRRGLAVAELEEGRLVAMDEGAHETTREAEAELVGRIRVNHIDVGQDYAAATVEAALPESGAQSSDGDMPMLLTGSEARAMAQRWLAESRLVRDRIRFTMPPSMGHLGAGDVVSLQRRGDQAPRRWRIEQVERAEAITADAVMTEPDVYRPAPHESDGIAVPRYVPPAPVWPVILDLPLMRGSEQPQAPHIAVAAKPWPGTVAVYGSGLADEGFALNRTVTRGSVIGRSVTPLRRAAHGLLDRGAPLEVEFSAASLRSIPMENLLQGGNMIAIGDGSVRGWEILQFGRAEPGAGSVWALSRRLRGQFGTDAVMPEVWPVGSVVVVLGPALEQLDVPPELLGQTRHFRIGPALRDVADATYRQRAVPIEGVGLMPLSPCHLRLRGGRLSWVRRTRKHGDRWDLADVPLAEEREAYLVRVTTGGALWEQEVSVPYLDLPGDVLSDLQAQGAEVAVAQISQTNGPGMFIKRSFP